MLLSFKPLNQIALFIKKIKKDFRDLLKNQPLCFDSLKTSYKYSYSKKKINKYKKFSNIRIIGVGGSILGAKAIYGFLFLFFKNP